jgi:predicted HTH domain antitoxin
MAMLPTIIQEEINAIIKQGYYKDESDLIRDAVRMLINTRSELKIASAIGLYQKKKVSLAKAAQLAGMTTIEFKDILVSRGIVRETEGKNLEELKEKFERLRV